MAKKRPTKAERERSERARRAWDTRRKREAAAAREMYRQLRELEARDERRREQQRRARQHREATEIYRQTQAERRSDAARKGWETRRARERIEPEAAGYAYDEPTDFDDFGDYEIEIGMDYEGD